MLTDETWGMNERKSKITYKFYTEHSRVEPPFTDMGKPVEGMYLKSVTEAPDGTFVRHLSVDI